MPFGVIAGTFATVRVAQVGPIQEGPCDGEPDECQSWQTERAVTSSQCVLIAHHDWHLPATAPCPSSESSHKLCPKLCPKLCRDWIFLMCREQ